MNRRTIKKIAKRYLDGGDVRRYILGQVEYWETPECTKTELVFPERIRLAIRREAYRRGWNGCHWGNPLVISIDSLVEPQE